MRNLSSTVPCLTPLPRTTEPIEVGLIVAKLLKFATGLLIALRSFATTGDPRPLRRGFLLGYLCGVFWYAGNCCWILLHDVDPWWPFPGNVGATVAWI